MKLKIKVKPRSGKQEIKKISEKEYLVCLKKPAEDNKANVELCKLLQRYFKKPVKIKSGFTNKNKIVEVLE
jgi:uncharacterized protein (TIGR00251 family)